MVFNNGKGNRVYKDTLFRFIFGRPEHKDWLLSLYNALNHSDFTNPDEISVTTLEDVIYVNMKNDVSFMIHDEMPLFEHQSSINPNMPLRGMMYYARLYEQLLEGNNIYSARLIKIPTPRYVVFYNGEKEFPEYHKMFLSEAFLNEPKLSYEWTAEVININKGMNEALLKACDPLREYCAYVNMVRERMEQGESFYEALSNSVDYAIKHDFLNGLFKKEREMFIGLGMTEYDEEKAKEVFRLDGLAEGRVEGAAEKKQEIIRNMLKQNLPLELIMKCTGATEEEVSILV